MSGLYDDLAATAVEMLAEFGQAAMLARPSATNPAYDPESGSVTPAGGGSYVVMAVVLVSR